MIYKDFLVKDIFRIENPKGKLKTKELIEGDDINYVAAKKTNNGIKMRCSRTNIPDNQIMMGNCIVFVQQGDGSAGYTTYQPVDFYAISCVCCGYIDNVLNEDVGLYLVSILGKNKKIFSHSASWSGDRLLETVITLPVLCENENPVINLDSKWHPEGYVPDWKYMEKEIKKIKNEFLNNASNYINELLTKKDED